MSSTQQSAYDSEVEEYEVNDYSDNEEEVSQTYIESEYDSGDEEFDIDGYLNNDETEENNQSPVSLEEAIISRAIQNLCQESIKTGKPLNSFRHDSIQFLENHKVFIEKFETQELEVYIDAMIEKNNQIGDCINQLSKVGVEKIVSDNMVNLKKDVLKKLKEAEDEMMKRQ